MRSASAVDPSSSKGSLDMRWRLGSRAKTYVMLADLGSSAFAGFCILVVHVWDFGASWLAAQSCQYVFS